MSDSKAPAPAPVITRTQYIEGEYSHNKYYAQFVTPDMIRLVRSAKIALNDSTAKWDALSARAEFSKAKLIETGEASNGIPSLTARVCTMKTALRALHEAALIAKKEGRTL